MKKFILYLTLIGFLLAGLTEIFGMKILDKDSATWIHYTNLYYFLLTLILFSISSVGFKSKSHKVFVKIVGMNMFLRMIFSLGFIVIVFIYSDLNIMHYVVANILLYFIYMAFEIKFLVPNLRPDSETRKNV